MPTNSETIVIIPTMNRATLVTDTLDAILNQTLQPDCLVIVDDGSTDNSLKVIRNWKNRTNPSFETKLIALPYNMGVSVARNVGLAQARSSHRYIYFLDSDDIPPAHFLQHATAALNQRPDAIAATSNRLFQYENRKVEFSNHKLMNTNPQSWFLKHGGGIVSPSLFRATSIRQLGGYNETLLTGQDLECFFRLANSGHWLHLSTCSTIIGRHQLHLNLRCHDSSRRWAHIQENCLDNFVKKNIVPRPNYRCLIAQKWKYAGLEILISLHSAKEARDCFRRSLSWNLSANIQTLVYLIAASSVHWLLTILNKFNMYNQFINKANQVRLKHKLRL